MRKLFFPLLLTAGLMISGCSSIPFCCPESDIQSISQTAIQFNCVGTLLSKAATATNHVDLVMTNPGTLWITKVSHAWFEVDPVTITNTSFDVNVLFPNNTGVRRTGTVTVLTPNGDTKVVTVTQEPLRYNVYLTIDDEQWDPGGSGNGVERAEFREFTTTTLDQTELDIMWTNDPGGALVGGETMEMVFYTEIIGLELGDDFNRIGLSWDDLTTFSGTGNSINSNDLVTPHPYASVVYDAAMVPTTRIKTAITFLEYDIATTSWDFTATGLTRLNQPFDYFFSDDALPSTGFTGLMNIGTIKYTFPNFSF